MRGAVSTLRFGVLASIASTMTVASGEPQALGRAESAGAQALDSPRTSDEQVGSVKTHSTQRTSGYLSLDRLDAYLELKADYARNRVDTDDRRSAVSDRRQTNRAWELEERLGLALSGHILDAQFLSFQGDFSFALTQGDFDEEIGRLDRSDTDRGYLLQYNLRANLLSGRKLSGSVYGLRQDDRVNRRFQPTLDRRRTEFGTSWTFAHEKFPMELSYDYRETDRTGNADARDDEHFTESTFRYGLRWLVSDHHRFKLSYEHARDKQEFQGLSRPFVGRRDLMILEHELEFGPEQRHGLRTLLHWQEESGDFARDLFEIGPQLTLHHSDDLQTMYQYQFNRERYEGLDVQTHRSDFQLIHRIYTNLITTVDAFALYEDIEKDVKTTQYGASIDWQYNRSNRFGHFHANLAVAYDTEDVTGANGRRVVLDEAGTFRDPVSVTLRNRNVVLATIIVTDATNRRVLQPGVDYVVAAAASATQLVRVRNGRIADGDTVLIDYQFATPADGQLDTVRVDLSLEQRFSNGLTPYYRLSYRNQEDDVSRGFPRRADRTNHHRLGAHYDAKRFSLGAELEIFDDTVDPYDAFHLRGAWHLLNRVDQTLDASTRVSRLFFEGGFDDRDVTMIDIELGHRWRLTERLSAVERVGYRFEDDSVAGDTHAWDVTAGFEYVAGDLSGEVTFEYDRLELPGSEEEDIGVYFRLRRDLPHVLAR